MFTHEPQPVPPLDERTLDRPQQVPVNMYETGDALVVVAAMPGVMPEDVRVSLVDGVLTLQSDLRSIATKRYLLREWLYGRYERVLQLPVGFDGPMTASYGNGQLAVRVLRRGDREDVASVVPA